MLRTQAKKQSSFYVCASCRRQHQQHQHDPAHLRPSCRIRSYYTSTTSRPFVSTAPTASKLSISSAPWNGATRPYGDTLFKNTRPNTRGYIEKFWGKYGSQTVPRQASSAWGAPPKNNPTPATQIPTSPAWGGPGRLPAATGTSAWRGPSTGSPAPMPGPVGPAWGGGNSMPPGPGGPAWGAGNHRPPGPGGPAWAGGNKMPTGPGAPAWGAATNLPQGPGVPPAWPGAGVGPAGTSTPAWGGPSTVSRAVAPVPSSGGAIKLPPAPGTSASGASKTLPQIVALTTGPGTLAWSGPSNASPATTPVPPSRADQVLPGPGSSITGSYAGIGLPPTQHTSSASGSGGPTAQSAIRQAPDPQTLNSTPGVKADLGLPHRATSIPPFHRGASPIISSSTSQSLNSTPTPNQPSTTPTQPSTSVAQPSVHQQPTAPHQLQTVKVQSSPARGNDVASTKPQPAATSKATMPQLTSGLASSPSSGDTPPARPLPARDSGALWPASSASTGARSPSNQPSNAPGMNGAPGFVTPPSGGVSGTPGLGSFPPVHGNMTLGAPVGSPGKPMLGGPPGAVAGKSTFRSPPGAVAGQPIFGGPFGAVAGKPAFGVPPTFGGPSGAVAGKPAFGGPFGWVPGKPVFGGTTDWNPSKHTFGGDNTWNPDKTKFAAPSKPTVNDSAFPANKSESSNWKLSGEVLYTASPLARPSAQNAQNNISQASSESPHVPPGGRKSDPFLDTVFMKPPLRKPDPGAAFPQLPRRSKRRDWFESMSPFNLPPRKASPDSKTPAPNSPTNMSPGPPSTDLDQPYRRENRLPRKDRYGSWSTSPTPLTSADFDKAFQNDTVSANSGFPTLSKPQDGANGVKEERYSHRSVPNDDWDDAPPFFKPRQPEIPSTDQKAAPPEERRKGKDSDRKGREKGNRRRGRDIEENDEDIYAARDKARKKSGGIRKQHVAEDEGHGDFDDFEAQRAKRQRRLKIQADKRAAEEKAAAAHKTILLPEYITVYDLAEALRIKPANFLRDLEQLGFENTLQDSVMTGETAALVAAEYGFEPTVESGADVDLRPRPPPEDLSSVPPRPPIVTIMGHVDHGKTTILDTMRKSCIVAQEFGGITQHIGAFSVKLSQGKAITFLDTPGHAAFLNMRQRGANVTDIVVLVVAVDDSVKPQTIEAIKHAQNAKVPMIVAINKIDLDDTANRIGMVKQDLASNGVVLEDHGGDVQAVAISGKTGRGMRELEDAILTLSEVLDTRAETDGMAEGWVLETSIKTDGRAATILVKRGTLRVGDLIVVGNAYTRVRIMKNEGGLDVKEAGPGTPVEIYGTWKGEPMAGDMVLQAPDETRAQAAVDYRQEIADRAIAAAQNAEREVMEREKAEREALIKKQEEEADEDAEVEAAPVAVGPKVVSIIVKGDVMGSVEAVSMAIQEIGNNEVRPRILFSSPGQITKSDVDHMATARGAIVNFNNAIPGQILQRAKLAGVVILDHNIIYETVQAVKDLLSAQLPPLYSQRVLAEATVAKVFPINITKRKFKNSAGVKVGNGKITRGGQYRVMRDGEEIHKGKLSALKQGKNDAKEVGSGVECGMMFEEFDDFKEGDRIQLYEDVEQKRYL